MTPSDAEGVLDLTPEASVLDQANIARHPRLLSDNGPRHVSAQLADYLGDKSITHTPGAPHHP